MRDDILGICRFSFLGSCDWAETQGKDGNSPELLARRAALIYAPKRLERRFTAFETLCLPSIRAQTDSDFRFLILTSPELPPLARERLMDLCAGLRQVRVLLSEKRNTLDALRPELQRAAAEAGRPVIQFRLDDDDALSRHHVARIRRHALRFTDLPAFGISYPRGLVFGSYGGAPVSFWNAHQPFMSAGATVRLRRAGRSVYAFNHFQIPKNMPGFTDTSGLGYVQTRWDEGDSVASIAAPFPKWFKPMRPAAFHAELAEDFPFLQGVDLGFAQKRGAA
ncbi:MAG: glycosyltransferase [Paracoccus sp. (in: a-proteobacteria)]|uniref:glycosyltransferase n=1 Tax=Paracoccus sp. TaxID=267 RepID=UPI0039E5E909